MVVIASKFRINLKDYTFPYLEVSEKPKEVGEAKDKPKEKVYEVKKVIFGIMLSPQQRYNGFRFLSVSRLASRIKNCTEEMIDLDNAEYTILKTAFDTFIGFGPLDTELVERIYEPERVSV